MAVFQTPDGKVVEIADGASPQVMARVKAQYGITDNDPAPAAPAAPQTRTARVAAGMPRKPDDGVQRDANFREKFGGGSDAASRVMDGMTFGLLDKAGAGALALIKGGYHDLTGSGPGIRDTYNHERAVQTELDKRYDDKHPYLSTGAELLGAVMNPIGVEGRGALAGIRAAAKAAGMTRTAAKVGKVAEHVVASPVASAIGSGMTTGALNAAGHSDSLSDLPGNAVEGALVGGVAGGALGGGASLVRKGLQTIKDAGAKAATRTAYQRVAELLDNVGMTGKQAERRIAGIDALGGDAMVQDMSPALRGKAAYLSTLPDVKGSNELIERGEQRIGERQAKFGDKVRETAAIPEAGDDALARMDEIKAGRKAQGKTDYAAGGAMDTAITPTPELQSFLRDAPKETQSALRHGYDEMLLRREKPADFTGDENGIFTHIPNLRTFDYVKRGFDKQISAALNRGGDGAGVAQGLSEELGKLRDVLSRANPNDAQYQQILATQRDAFQKQKALELGQSVMSRMTKQPRLALRDLKALEPHQIDDARIGIIDALINTDTKADPVGHFRSIMRNDSQRKIMEFAFGGKGNLGRFQRWVNREHKASVVDSFTSVGRQSGTGRYAGAADSNGEQHPANEVLMAGFRGFGFGGTTGLVGNTVRALERVATRTSKVTQEEIAKILLSKGEGLDAGIKAAKEYTKRRARTNQFVADRLGKAGQQVFTDKVGVN